MFLQGQPPPHVPSGNVVGPLVHVGEVVQSTDPPTEHAVVTPVLPFDPWRFVPIISSQSFFMDFLASFRVSLIGFSKQSRPHRSTRNKVLVAAGNLQGTQMLYLYKSGATLPYT